MARIFLVLGLILVLLHSKASAQSRSDKVQAMIQQWLAIEQQADHLQRDWSQQQIILEQRLQLLNAEKASLKAHLIKHSSHQSEVQKTRVELAQQQNQLEKNQIKMTAALQLTANNIGAMTTQLPQPLAEHWQQTLSKPLAEKSNSEKLDRYLTLLKAMDEFNKKITRHQTLMLVDGKQILVDQVYLGLSQGWYLSRDNQHAGIGHASSQGWQWQADNSLVPMLSDIITALKQPEKARLLPIKINLVAAQP